MISFLKFGLKFGRVYVTLNYQQNEENILGISIFQHPFTSTGINLQKMMRIGMGLNSIFNLKLNHITNLSNLIQKFETIHKKILNQKENPHWTLLLVCTSEKSKGIGSDLLFPIFKLADETDIPIFTCLFFSNQEYEKFFKNNGFDLIEKIKTNQTKNKHEDIDISSLIRKPK